MGSFQEDAPFQASHASFKREAQVAAADEEEEQDSRSRASVDELNAAKGPLGRRSRAGSSVTDISSNASINYRSARRQDKIGGEGFWCGVFCMHLPGLSRRRPMQQSMSLSEPDTRASTAEPAETARASVVSKVASMERFKYSSSSSGIVFERVDEEEEQEASAYFDLPLELLRISSVDAESPVTAAFVFNGNHGRGLKKSVQPELPDLDFSFPAPPAFSSPSSPRS